MNWNHILTYPLQCEKLCLRPASGGGGAARGITLGVFWLSQWGAGAGCSPRATGLVCFTASHVLITSRSRPPSWQAGPFQFLNQGAAAAHAVHPAPRVPPALFTSCLPLTQGPAECQMLSEPPWTSASSGASGLPAHSPCCPSRG